MNNEIEVAVILWRQMKQEEKCIGLLTILFKIVESMEVWNCFIDLVHAYAWRRKFVLWILKVSRLTILCVSQSQLLFKWLFKKRYSIWVFTCSDFWSIPYFPYGQKIEIPMVTSDFSLGLAYAILLDFH